MLKEMNFKIGDKVECINDQPHSCRKFKTRLTLGKIYIIRSLHSSGIIGIEDNGKDIGWYFDRFKLFKRKKIE